MELFSKILIWLTKYTPTNLGGWHQVFSIFTVIMMIISQVYSNQLGDFHYMNDRSCYLENAMIIWMKCRNEFLTIFWNSFHPQFSIYLLFGSYYFPLIIFIYFSALRGIYIISYKVFTFSKDQYYRRINARN